jgi:hypothetical protein
MAGWFRKRKKPITVDKEKVKQDFSPPKKKETARTKQTSDRLRDAGLSDDDLARFRGK